MHFRNVTQPRFTICVRSLKHLCIPICPCVICFHLTREKDRDKNDASKNFSWKDVYVQTTNLRISSPNQPSKRVRNSAKRVRNSIKRNRNTIAPKGSGILPVRVRNTLALYWTKLAVFRTLLALLQTLLELFLTLLRHKLKWVSDAASNYWRYSIPFSKGSGTLPKPTSSIPDHFQKVLEHCQNRPPLRENKRFQCGC